MAAQDEREPGGLVCSNVLGPMVQDIPVQDIVMGEQELPPQMDPKPEMAAVYDTSPPPKPTPDPCRNGSAECARHNFAGTKRNGKQNNANNGCEHAGVQEQYAGTAG